MEGFEELNPGDRQQNPTISDSSSVNHRSDMPLNGNVSLSDYHHTCCNLAFKPTIDLLTFIIRQHSPYFLKKEVLLSCCLEFLDKNQNHQNTLPPYLLLL